MAQFSTLSSVEPLEARIAPATLTFVDIDGDQVTITTSKGSNDDLAAAVNPFLVDSGSGKLLQKLDLASNPVFQGSNLYITVASGSVNVGYIDATGLDLGRVTITGDVGQIDAGDTNVSTPAIKQLEVGSLGVFAEESQGPNFSLVSDINGSLPKVIVHGDVEGTLKVDGGSKDAAGRIGSIEIDGSLVGGDQVDSGSIIASGVIGKVSIGGSLKGGTASQTGAVFAASLGSVFVGGNLEGNSGAYSAAIRSFGNIGKVQITGNILGGLGVNSDHSAEIRAAGTIGSAQVTGFVKGGDGDNSGAIDSGTALGSVKVDGGITGGAGLESGTIGSAGTVNNVVIGGTGLDGGDGERSGSVIATGKIINVTVTGGLTGGEGEKSGTIATEGFLQKVTITGGVTGGLGDDSGAIGSIKSLGTVVINGDLQGGEGFHSGTILSSTSIGSVVVNGSVKGDLGFESGAIGSVGPVGSVKITGNLEGLDDGEIRGGTNSGAVISATLLSKVEIGGSIFGGSGTNSGAVLSFGSINSVEVGGNVEGGSRSNSGSIVAYGKINRVLIEGSLQGGAGSQSGMIRAIGGSAETEPEILAGLAPRATSGRAEPFLKSIVIKGDVQGADGSESGTIISDGRIGVISIGAPALADAPLRGNLAGGLGFRSGSIRAADNIDTINVYLNIAGTASSDASSQTGSIFSGGNLGRLNVGGNLLGGSGFYGGSSEGSTDDGQVFARGKIGTVLIGDSIIGGSGGSSATIRGGSIGSVFVKGFVQAGEGFYSSSIVAQDTDIGVVKIRGALTTEIFEGESQSVAGDHSASIAAARNIGMVEVGEIVGTSGGDGLIGIRVQITAGGTIGAKTDAQALSIRSISTERGMAFADILAGYDVNGSAVNPDAQIGTVQIGAKGTSTGQWISNNVVAGSSAGFDGQFGTSDDVPIASSQNSPNVISKIARIVTTGGVTGSGQGIVAELVNFISVANQSETQLTKGPRNDFFILSGDTSDGTVVNEPTGNIETPR